MNDKLKYYLIDIKKNEGASNELIREVQGQLDFDLPVRYKEVIQEFNGGEGEVGNGWLLLFKLEELLNINEVYDYLMEQIPEYFLFGKDCADTGYAFHKLDHTYYSFGLMSNFKTDPMEFCGNSFEEILEYLYNS